MKKYCLTENAKIDMRYFVEYISIVVVVFYVALTLVGILFILTGFQIEKNTPIVNYIFYYNGLIGGIVIILLIIFNLIKWLRRSIIKCEEGKNDNR